MAISNYTAPGDPNDPNSKTINDPDAYRQALLMQMGMPQPTGDAGGGPTRTVLPMPTVTGPAVPGASAPPAAAPAASPNSGLPQWLQDVYSKAGVTDGGRGAGFTDGAYWSDKQDQAGRLAADLAGTGTDQPGPKDSGASLNSGKGSPVPGGGAMAGGAPANMLGNLSMPAAGNNGILAMIQAALQQYVNTQAGGGQGAAQ